MNRLFIYGIKAIQPVGLFFWLSYVIDAKKGGKKKKSEKKSMNEPK